MSAQRLQDYTSQAQPIIHNDWARLWDIGDGIACLELTTKLDIIDHPTFDMVQQALARVQQDFDGLIIGDDDPQYSAGLNLKHILQWCDHEDWQAIDGILQRGQQCWKQVKYAPFPVVGAPGGIALGGACELLLHCDGIQAHEGAHIGLVEVNIQVVPGWGGCKELLAHHLQQADTQDAKIAAAKKAFEIIAGAEKSENATQAQEWKIPRRAFGITQQRDELIGDAKHLCQQLVQGYTVQQATAFDLPWHEIAAGFTEMIAQQRHLSAHQTLVLECLAYVLSGGAYASDTLALPKRKPECLSEDALLDLERAAFMRLIQTQATQKRIRDVLHIT